MVRSRAPIRYIVQSGSVDWAGDGEGGGGEGGGDGWSDGKGDGGSGGGDDSDGGDAVVKAPTALQVL